MLQHFKGLLGHAKKLCFASKLLQVFDLNRTKIYILQVPKSILSIIRPGLIIYNAFDFEIVQYL